MGKSKSARGFTLIELLIVIAIVGLLAAVAIPYYQGYIIRSRLVEVENAISLVKNAVTTYYQDTEGAWPNCPTMDEIRNSLGIGLGSITRISRMDITSGVITATIQNIDPMINGKFLRLIPIERGDGSINWIWGWSPDFPVHLRPKMN